MNERAEPSAVVLLSGGLDSATTLALARERGFRCHALTVDYGQRQRVEIERAREVAVTLGAVRHEVVRVDLTFAGGSALTDADLAVPKSSSADEIGDVIPITYVPARNTVLLSVALAWAEALGAGDLFLGVNAIDYSGYPDCRPEFLRCFEELARRATRAGTEGRDFRIHAPLQEWSKGRIIQEAQRLRVDLSRTVSCYEAAPDGGTCGACDACLLRARGFREAGLDDPALG